jgi:hypothetical protein
MFRGTKSILNGEAGGTDNRKGKRKRAEEDEEMAEPEVKRKSKPAPEVEDEEAEESSGVDENHPKKFDWEMNIRNLLVTIYLSSLNKSLIEILLHICFPVLSNKLLKCSNSTNCIFSGVC